MRRFEDVTSSAGLGEPISTESAAWGDYDNDGRLDLFVCGEYLPTPAADRGGTPATRPRTVAGSTTTRATASSWTSPPGRRRRTSGWAKGTAWGDYDNDGRLDLFVSNMDGPPRLYRNMGDGTFQDVAPAFGIVGAAPRLHLHVLGLRQRRPARSLRRRLCKQSRRSRGRSAGVDSNSPRPRPRSTTTSAAADSAR